MNPSIAALAGMKVRVAGGAGYIGSVCVAELPAADCRLTVCDNLSEGVGRVGVAPAVPGWL